MECSDQNTIRGQSAGSPHAGGLTLFDTINTRPDIEYSYNNIYFVLTLSSRRACSHMWSARSYWAGPASSRCRPSCWRRWWRPPRGSDLNSSDNEDKSSWYFSTYQAVSLWSPLLRVFCPESKALCYIVLHCIITLYYIHSLAFLIV